MSIDLEALLSTPELTEMSPVHVRLVCAMRYFHVSRRQRTYCCRMLATQIGNPLAVRPFHVFMDEAGRAWPDPIVLGPPCRMRLSYDEMLLVDLCTASARNDRAAFDDLVGDMIGVAQRRAIWSAARRLMGKLVRLIH